MEASEYRMIDNYLLGRLKGKELETFEQKLQSDAVFAQTVEEQKQAIDVLRKLEDMELKMEVQEVQQKFQKERKPVSTIRRLRPWLAAAAAVLILVVSYIVLKGPNHKQLFNTYYAAYDTSFGDRDASDDIKIKLAEASRLYKQKDYAQALPNLESLLPEVDNSKLQLMIGICHLELNNYDKALPFFNQLYEKKDPAFQYHGLWYSAMTYLKSGNITQCKSQLQKLLQATDPNGVYKQAESKELLEKI